MTIQQKIKYLDACVNGDIDMVMHMLQNEDKKFKNRHYLLECIYKACEGGHPDVYEAIHLYNDIFSKFERNLLDCALRKACKRGNIKMINKIQETYTKLYNDNVTLDTIIASINGACEGGHLELFLLFTTSVHPNPSVGNMFKREFPKQLNSLFGRVCGSGNAKMVKFFIKTYKENIELNTGLKNACLCGNLDIVKILVNKGAHNLDSGLINACLKGNIEIVKYMTHKGALASGNGNIFYSACIGGNMEIINYMIENGFNNLALWDLGLCGACQGGHMDIINHMIEKGANNWNEALSAAVKPGVNMISSIYKSEGAARLLKQLEIIKYIIQKGALNFNTGDGLCLYCACYGGDIDFVKFLIKNINVNDNTDWNCALRYACRGGNIEAVRLMLKNGATNLNNGLYNTSDAYVQYLLITEGADDVEYVSDTTDFKLYCLYCNCSGTKPYECKYMTLLQEYPPCVLFIGSTVSRQRWSDGYDGYGGYGKKCSVSRLPVELFRLLFAY